MARMKFLCDADRCIECNACVTACKNENEVPWGINRRRVVTLNDGKPGERSVSMACMHCTDAPCAAVCPVNCFYITADAVVLHSKDLCIGCGYCFYACLSLLKISTRLGSTGECRGPAVPSRHGYDSLRPRFDRRLPFSQPRLART